MSDHHVYHKTLFSVAPCVLIRKWMNPNCSGRFRFHSKPLTKVECKHAKLPSSLFSLSPTSALHCKTCPLGWTANVSIECQQDYNFVTALCCAGRTHEAQSQLSHKSIKPNCHLAVWIANEQLAVTESQIDTH